MHMHMSHVHVHSEEKRLGKAAKLDDLLKRSDVWHGRGLHLSVRELGTPGISTPISKVGAKARAKYQVASPMAVGKIVPKWQANKFKKLKTA